MDELLDSWLPYILLCVGLGILVILSKFQGEDQQQQQQPYQPPYQRQQGYYQQDYYQQRHQQQHYHQQHSQQQRSQQQHYQQAPAWPRPPAIVPQPAPRLPVQQPPSTPVRYLPKPPTAPKPPSAPVQYQPRPPSAPKPFSTPARYLPKPPTAPNPPSTSAWYQPNPPSVPEPPAAQYQPELPTERRLSDPCPVPVDDDVEPRESPYYHQLRTQAREEGDAMAKAFDASKIAFKNGQKARAKQLSNEGKKHKAEMERLNKEASDWVFEQNNLDSAPGVIDLHGLFVKEAIEKAETAVQAAQARGDAQIRIIVGKGLHSQGAARIKPAIEELMVKYQLSVQIDPRNAGVLVVQLGGRGEDGMEPSEVTRLLERDDERRFAIC